MALTLSNELLYENLKVIINDKMVLDFSDTMLICRSLIAGSALKCTVLRTARKRLAKLKDSIDIILEPSLHYANGHTIMGNELVLCKEIGFKIKKINLDTLPDNIIVTYTSVSGTSSEYAEGLGIVVWKGIATL